MYLVYLVFIYMAYRVGVHNERWSPGDRDVETFTGVDVLAMGFVLFITLGLWCFNYLVYVN